MKLIETRRDIIVWTVIPIWTIINVTLFLIGRNDLTLILNLGIPSIFAIIIVLEGKLTNNKNNKLREWLNTPVKNDKNKPLD